MPPHFAARVELTATLKRAVLEGRTADVGVGAEGAAGLHGPGGRGKTVLAQVLANDDEILRAFPDGVFWVTVGQEPDVLTPCAVRGRAGSGQPQGVPGRPP
jgi:hypothetical protein